MCYVLRAACSRAACENADMDGSRQRRSRVLEVLERRAKQFKTREQLYPCRIPREPVPFADVIQEALRGDGHRFDPLSLRSRTLLRLGWDDGNSWELWILMLSSGLKLFCDSGAEEPRILASGGRVASAQTDRQFLGLLAESGGEHFGIEMSGDAPTVVRSSITDRAFLVDVFVELFEVTKKEASVREQLRDTTRAPSADGRDFRTDVDTWLGRALR
jgi:hypothetical protein